MSKSPELHAELAFIANPSYPRLDVEAGAAPAPEGPAEFPTGWSKNRGAPYQWLARDRTTPQGTSTVKRDNIGRPIQPR